MNKRFAHAVAFVVALASIHGSAKAQTQAQPGKPAAWPTAAASASPTPPLSGPGHGTPAQLEERPPDQRILFGGILLGIGLAAVAAGAAVGIVAAAKYADLDCPDDTCPPSEHEAAQTYEDLRVPSGLTIAAGGLLSFVGAVFVLNGMSDGDQEVALTVRPDFVGVEARF